MQARPFAQGTHRLAQGIPFLTSCAAFILYISLARQYPVMYWGDAYTRLALRDQILLGHWLPLLQLVVFVISKLTPDLFVLRCVFAAIAALTVASMYALARRAFDPLTGFLAAGLLATNLLFVALATVPYSEVLFTGLVLTALAALEDRTRRHALFVGLLALNLACLTRYEGWLLAAILVIEAALRSFRKGSWRTVQGETIKFASLVSLVPLAWLLFAVNLRSGLMGGFQAIVSFERDQPAGNPLIPIIDPANIVRFAGSYFHTLGWQAGLPVILAGLGGWLMAIRSNPHRALHLRILVFVVLDWCLIVLWRPWDADNLRQAFVMQVALVLYAAHGLVQVMRLAAEWLASRRAKLSMRSLPNWAVGALAFAVILGALPGAVEFAAGTNAQPEFHSAQRVGMWLSSRLSRGDAVWVLSDAALPSYEITTYTDLPFEDVPDHRFDVSTVEAKLRPASQVYVVCLYRSRAGLSANENLMLRGLESGQIRSQYFTVANRDIWEAQGNELLRFFDSR